MTVALSYTELFGTFQEDRDFIAERSPSQCPDMTTAMVIAQTPEEWLLARYDARVANGLKMPYAPGLVTRRMFQLMSDSSCQNEDISSFEESEDLEVVEQDEYGNLPCYCFMYPSYPLASVTEQEAEALWKSEMKISGSRLLTFSQKQMFHRWFEAANYHNKLINTPEDLEC